jgi:hypothetical protein
MMISIVSTSLLLMILGSADARKKSVAATPPVGESPRHSELRVSALAPERRRRLEMREDRSSIDHNKIGHLRRSSKHKGRERKDNMNMNNPWDFGNFTSKKRYIPPDPKPVRRKVSRVPETHSYSAVSSSVLIDGRSQQPRCDKTWDQYASSEYCSSFPDARRVYFHAIFDLLRPSSLPLLAHQVCRAMAHCIAPQNFRIALHTLGASSRDLVTVNKFLAKYGIKTREFDFIFDTYKARNFRIEMLADVASQDKLVWQVDMDEFPDVSELRRMAAVLLDPSHKCDVFMGLLRDRLPQDGSMVNISLSTQIGSVFPLQCDVKETIEIAATRKVILYKSTYRPKPGNHALSYMGEMSRPTVVKRCGDEILKSIGRESSIHIDHFKYVWGIEKYLADRAAHFKKQRINWHVESERAVQYLQQGRNGSICTSCPEFGCMPGPPILY